MRIFSPFSHGISFLNHIKEKRKKIPETNINMNNSDFFS